MKTTKEPTRKQRKGEAGVGLVESIVGILVFTILMLVAGQLLRVHVETLVLAERQRKAGKQAEAGLNDLVSKKRSELTVGGAFAVDAAGAPARNADNTVTLNCAAAINVRCDQIVAVPQANGTGVDYVRVAQGATIPTGAQAVYTRAWAVTTIDAAKGLRRITYAVFPSGDAIDREPIIFLRTEAVQRN